AYTAVSYAWGNDRPRELIYLDGRAFQVRRNLWSCLYYLSLHAEHEAWKHIWVDAICINQNDLDEKSEQVPIMGEIYSRATKVYAWLGEADRQMNCVFDALQEFRDRKREAKFATHFDAAEQLSFYRQLFRDIYQDKAEFNWLRPLYVRPYWRRVWIVQELVLAKVVVVCCG
ncbi:hypothetical protein K469DRAFT_487701, partial [Zopfia rhizophila CBS 207.26]